MSCASKMKNGSEMCSRRSSVGELYVEIYRGSWRISKCRFRSAETSECSVWLFLQKVEPDRPFAAQHSLSVSDFSNITF